MVLWFCGSVAQWGGWSVATALIIFVQRLPVKRIRNRPHSTSLHRFRGFGRGRSRAREDRGCLHGCGEAWFALVATLDGFPGAGTAASL